jgi:hypothetical protein
VLLKKYRKLVKVKPSPKQAVEELDNAIKEENKFRKELEAEVNPQDKELGLVDEPKSNPNLK